MELEIQEKILDKKIEALKRELEEKDDEELDLLIKPDEEILKKYLITNIDDLKKLSKTQRFYFVF